MAWCGGSDPQGLRAHSVRFPRNPQNTRLGKIATTAMRLVSSWSPVRNAVALSVDHLWSAGFHDDMEGREAPCVESIPERRPLDPIVTRL
jgi:hypothetical protein